MARVNVYNPQGVSGTLEEGDTVGSTFIPDAPSPFQAIPRAVAGLTLPPFLKAAQLGTAFIPTHTLAPAGIAGGTALGLAAPIPGGPAVAAGAGGLLGQTLAEMRQAQGQRPQPGAEGRIFGAAGTGVATGGGIDIGKSLLGLGRSLARGVLPNLFPNRLTALAEKARGTLGEVVQGAGPAMGSELANLPGTVNARPVIENLSRSMTHPELGGDLTNAVFKGIQTAGKLKDTTLRDFLNNPELAETATPLQVQQVMNTLKQVPSIARLAPLGRGTLGTAGKGAQFLQQVNDTDLELLQHINDLKQTIVQAYPKQYPEIAEKFGETQAGFRELRPLFSKKGLEGNIKGGFGSGEIRKVVSQTLPQDLVRELFAVQPAQRALGVLGKTAEVGVGLAALRELFHKTQ